MSFLSPKTILPYYVRQLTTSNVAIGAIPALSLFGALVPQILAAPASERRPVQRRFVLWVALVERLPYLVLALATYLLGFRAPSLLQTIFLLSLAANAVCMGLNIPAYTTLVSKVIRPQRRGRLFGMGNGVSGVLAFGGAALSGWLLSAYPPRVAFSLCFLLGFLVLLVTVLPLGFVREPRSPVPAEHEPFSDYLRGSLKLLRDDPQYARFLASQVLLSLSGIASSFYTVHAMDRFRISGERGAEIGLFTMALMLSTVVGGFLWGHVGDQRGNRVLLALGTVSIAVLSLGVLWAPTVAIFTAMFFLSGLATSALDLASFNIVMEFSPEGRVPTYSALRATVIAPVACASLAAGRLTDLWMDRWGYAPLFLFAAVCATLSLLLLSRVREPRHERVPAPSVLS
jgi:MFS family permease